MKMVLTTEQKRALQSIWEMLGQDLGPGEYTKDDVVELVLDANRPYVCFPEIDWSEFKQLPLSERYNVASAAFSYDMYLI